MAYSYPLRIQLYQPHGSFTNLDEIAGHVHLSLVSQETISGITVKLEGESRTRLAGVTGPPGGYDPYARNQTQLEVHKLLYKINTVFPTADVAASAPRSQYTLSPGQYSYSFRFKIPFNNDCINNNSLLTNLSSIRMDVQGPAAHVKKTLPPTLGGLPGEAEIQYYVKATVQRPAFYKENWRYNANFLFFPIEPPRPPPNKRESFARVQHQFSPTTETPEKPGLFRRSSTVTSNNSVTPPSISVEGRLPDPAIITCNEALPLRLLVTKLNDSPAKMQLDMLHIDLLAFTTIRAQQLKRNEITSWTIVSTSNMRKQLVEEDGNKIIELPSSLWTAKPLPNNVSPTFHTCNISRTYGLQIKVGLSWSVGNKHHPEMNVQLLRMPCQVYSGVAPPPALLEAMANQGHLDNIPPPTPARPSAPNGILPGTANTRPTQTTDHIEPSPEDIPPDAPPSYEDAMADRVAPIDGPRRDYEQNAPRPGAAGEKAAPRLFDENP